MGYCRQHQDVSGVLIATTAGRRRWGCAIGKVYDDGLLDLDSIRQLTSTPP